MTPDRLSDAFLDRLATTAAAEGLADAVYAAMPSPLGRLLVVQSDRGVCRIGFAEEPEDAILAQVAARLGSRVLRSRTDTAPAREQLEAYLEGDATALELPVDMRLVRSPFQRDVLDELRRVPRGDVTTYGRLAARIGRPRAVRATGTALGRNPVPIVVPCHRVLPSTGGVGNYGGGPERKRALLRLEGALPESPTRSPRLG
jgi:methylated-DNA-[protein]-cysteine S-methyltransferase